MDPFEVPDDVDLSQDSDLEIIGTHEPGYNLARALGVKKLLQYFYDPEVDCLGS